MNKAQRVNSKFELRVVDYDLGGHRHPIARSGHRMVSLGKDIYVWGGINTDVPEDHPVYAKSPIWAQTNPCFREMWKYSYVSNKWQLMVIKGQIPEHLVGFGMCIVGDIIYVYGGTQIPVGQKITNRLYSFDISTGVWTLLTTYMTRFPLPEKVPYGPPVAPDPSYGAAVTGIGYVYVEHQRRFPTSCIYVFGGVENHMPPIYFNSLHEFNTSTTVWTHLQNMATENEYLPLVVPDFQFAPPPAYRAELAYHNDLVYVLGGGDTLFAQQLEVIRAYNLRTRKWETYATAADVDDSDKYNIINNGYPPGRRDFACAQYRHQVFIIGGTNSYDVFDDIWRLDLETNRWTYICRMPTPLKFHAASVSDEGVLSIFGGVSDHACYYRNRVLLTMRLDVQRLEDLSFNTVSQSVSALHPLGYRPLLQQIRSIPGKYKKSLI